MLELFSYLVYCQIWLNLFLLMITNLVHVWIFGLIFVPEGKLKTGNVKKQLDFGGFFFPPGFERILNAILVY